MNSSPALPTNYLQGGQCRATAANNAFVQLIRLLSITYLEKNHGSSENR